MEVALLRDASPDRCRLVFPRPAVRCRSGGCWREGSWTHCGSFPAVRRLCVAVDDAQWLDRPSAGVLEFCFRRLQREPVSILLTFRDDDRLSRSAWTGLCRRAGFAVCRWAR